MQRHLWNITPQPKSAAPFKAAFLVLLLGSACSSVSGGIKDPANPPSGPSALAAGQKVGRIEVGLDTNQLPDEVVEVAEQYETTKILTNRVRQRLENEGMNGGADLEVKVDIIGMRLRSNGTAIWWGFFAGSDWVTVDVEVRERGQPVKRFQTGTSTSFGGFTGGGRSVRVGRMMKTLAERIVAGI